MAKSTIGSFARSLVAAGAVSGALGVTAVPAATFDLGVLPTDGTTLVFTQTTRTGDTRDIYNFTLAEQIDKGTLTEFLRLETVAASFDTVIELFDASDMGGRRISASDDNYETECGDFYCSTISAGNDPGAGAMRLAALPAGDYSLLVRGYAEAVGDYTLEITSLLDDDPSALLLSAGPHGGAVASRAAQPAHVPLPASALLLLGGLAAAAGALRRRSARA